MVLHFELFIEVTTLHCSDPTKEPVPSPIGGPATVWEPSTVDNLYYLYAGNDYIEQREDYRQQEYALWHSYLNTMLTGEDWPFPYSGMTKRD